MAHWRPSVIGPIAHLQQQVFVDLSWLSQWWAHKETIVNYGAPKSLRLKKVNQGFACELDASESMGQGNWSASSYLYLQ